MASSAESQPHSDDSFELYDLRVEVVCPPGERILCGAKDGDYFTLQGEMMFLPPGQGVSLYSLGRSDPEEVGRANHPLASAVANACRDQPQYYLC